MEDDTLPLVLSDLKSRKKNPGVSSFAKGGFGLLLTAFVDMVVAFSTGYWATWSRQDQYGGYGLWKVWQCTTVKPQGDGTTPKPVRSSSLYQSTVGSICHERLADLSFPDWYIVTQAALALALAGLLVSLILMLVYMFLPQYDHSKYVMSTVIGVGYASGMCQVVALFVFAFKVCDDVEQLGVSEWFLSWSFSLACTAFVLSQIAASILITETKRLFQHHHDHPVQYTPNDGLDETHVEHNPDRHLPRRYLTDSADYIKI